MKKYLQMGLLSLFIVVVVTACERMGDTSSYGLFGNATDTKIITEPKEAKEVRDALYKDAQLARTMPLKQFARHMKTRHNFYRRYRLQHQDDYVKIDVNGNEMRIQTQKGRVKLAHGS
ncbi:hypothetical protein [Pontibacter cellulosilyticus]|uniref:Uncharacterized protein n=1 Tax=Pontibacter cellulosilyticus TaxID=1720253 RepID=A0A923N6G0_9BACT|nr:hypothetical protein [Pontibacter cellulosilyticus]MBC5993780.1 hypothetical protein [Pontibacter cellulosilyticus]